MFRYLWFFEEHQVSKEKQLEELKAGVLRAT